jgi:D-glycero-D-manno-heptose 1,7-bisphosphate phosphatase
VAVMPRHDDPAAAVFLDKDGTLLVDVPYNVDPRRMRLLPGVAEALGRLDRAGYELVVVSNQSGVARGLFPVEALDAVGARLQELFEIAGARMAGFYFCPHLPGGKDPRYAVTCDCRKPAPGLLLRAAAELGVDLAASWILGDILDDVEAGNRAGCRSILVGAGHETEWVLTPVRRPWGMARDLPAAAGLVLLGASLPVTPRVVA